MKTIIVTFLLCLITSVSYSQTSITVSAGLATPNDKIKDVYNSERYGNGTNVWDRVLESAALGYNIGARLRFPLSNDFQASVGGAFVRFPGSDVVLQDTATHQVYATLTSTQNVVPISAGVDYFIFRKLISPYIGAELQYNYISNSVDYPVSGVGVPLNLGKEQIDNRVGAALAVGSMFDLGIVSLNLDIRYHMINLIGATADEKSKQYLWANLGVTFGWK